MGDPKAAIAEQMISNIKREDTATIDQVVTSNTDVVTWRSVLRYEFRLADLMDGILQSDIVVPKAVICDIHSISAFHYAALRGADAILTIFIGRLQMPIDMCLSNGSTALHFACFAGMLETVNLLLDKFKADISKRDNYGWSPLHYASVAGQLSVVENLVSRGVDISARDKDGTTAAYRAKLFKQADVVSFFLQSSGDDDLLLVGECEDKQRLSEQPIYTDVKTAKAAVAKMQSGLTPDERAAVKLIQENDYELPDKLITRIQCKYIPGSQQEPDNELLQPMSHHGSKETESDYLSGQNISAMNNNGVDADWETKREKSKAKIRKIVEHQLKDVFHENEDTYLDPRSGAKLDDQNKAIFGTGEGGIGFNTLKQVLRDEFLKFKAESMNEGGQLKEDDGIYEEISKEALSSKFEQNRWVVGGRTLRGTRRGNNQPNAPPLPPRNSMKITDELLFIKQTEEEDFSKAGIVLERIEESSAVMDACFRDLVVKLGVGDWQKLARALPLREKPAGVEERIKIIAKLHSNAKNQATEALKDWRNHYGKTADVRALITALKKSGLVEKVGVVEKSAREFSA